MAYTGADITVFAEDETLLMLVEVKPTAITSADWASKVRTELLRGRRNLPPFILIVGRDKSYLWKSDRDDPDFAFPTSDLLQPYLSKIGASTADIERSALELATGMWLVDLTNGSAPEETVVALRPSGVPDAVTNGHIRFLAAA